MGERISDMERRIAITLCCSQAGCRKGDGDFAVCQMGTFLDDARRVIRAMRQPTEPMVAKAWELIRSNLRYEEVYGHMVDAALTVESEDAS